MSDQPLEMWDYWRDKYGPIEALRVQFPDLLESDPVLSALVVQIEALTHGIEGRIAHLQAATPEDG